MEQDRGEVDLGLFQQNDKQRRRCVRRQNSREVVFTSRGYGGADDHDDGRNDRAAPRFRLKEDVLCRLTEKRQCAPSRETNQQKDHVGPSNAVEHERVCDVHGAV